MNAVRKHLSAIKGGRLAAAAAPARLVSLVISDVPGDDLSVIASGPTVRGLLRPSPTRAPCSPDIASTSPAASPRHLARARRRNAEAWRPSPRTDVENRLIATPWDALAAAASKAREAGYAPLILGDAIEGEARECGVVHAGVARQRRPARRTPAAPALRPHLGRRDDGDGARAAGEGAATSNSC